MNSEEATPESLPELESRRKKAVHAVLSFAAILVILVLVVALVIVLIATRKKPEADETVRILPAVQVLAVKESDHRLRIVAQGVVESMREVRVAAEVPGRVEYVSPNMQRGGRVEEGELLARLEKDDYLAALERAEYSLAQAEVALEQEEAKRDQALRDWEKLGRGEPTDLVLRKPQLASARALVDSAAAEVRKATRDVERTEIRAPFAARIRHKGVEVGSVAAPGTLVAELFSDERLEVRLPLSIEDFGFLDRSGQDLAGRQVRLGGEVGVENHTWGGRIGRLEGEIDQATRSAIVIVEVEPNRENPAHLHLPPVGLFVEGVIPGRTVEGAVEIPRLAMRGGQSVLVVDGESVARVRQVEVVRGRRETVLVRAGLNPGERIVLKGLRGVTAGGVTVRVVDEVRALPGEAAPEVVIE